MEMQESRIKDFLLLNYFVALEALTFIILFCKMQIFSHITLTYRYSQYKIDF